MKTVWRLLINEPDVTLPWMAEKQRIAIGWGEIGDVRLIGSRDDMAKAILERNATHPNHEGKPPVNAQHGSHSLFDFCFTMKPGDLVIISDTVKRREVWEVVGEYEYAGTFASPLNYQHQREARRQVAMDANELWQRAGGELRAKINYRTLDQCVKRIDD